MNCKFPFEYDGLIFHSCTNYKYDVSNLSNEPWHIWCPTNLDNSGKYNPLENDWGFCDPNCPFFDEKTETNKTRPFSAEYLEKYGEFVPCLKKQCTEIVTLPPTIG